MASKLVENSLLEIAAGQKHAVAKLLASGESVTRVMREADAITRSVRDSQAAQLERILVQVNQYAFDAAHAKAISNLMPALDRIWAGEIAAVASFTQTLPAALHHLASGFEFARDVQRAFDAVTQGIYLPPTTVWAPADWIDEQLDLLFAPEYHRSKLAWILAVFVPRTRLALYEQDRAGDFDQVMQTLWDDFIQDPEIRARLRDRLEKVKIREELRRMLSKHLDMLEEGRLEYVILGLYAHIEGFLTELAFERGFIPHPEKILCPRRGCLVDRKGVHELIVVLRDKGQISESQFRFLEFVLSNHFNSNRVRHGIVLDFSESRAAALVLALVSVLCLARHMEVSELLGKGAS